MDKQELLSLLHSWKQEYLLDHFIGEKVYVNVLRVMKRHHIQKLIKTFPIGVQIMFEHNLETWRESIGLPLSPQTDRIFDRSPSPPTSPQDSVAAESFRFSPYPTTSNRVPDSLPAASNVNLATILNDTEKGRMILEAYQKLPKLKQDQRIILMNIIAQYFIDHNIRLTLAHSYKVEEEIVDLFCGEKMEFYRHGKRGKIYNKFMNLKCSLKDIVKPNETKSKAPMNHGSTVFFPEPDAESCIDALKIDNLSGEKFDVFWQACSQYRLNQIHQATSTVEIFEKWPQYKSPFGFRLIDMDYDSAYHGGELLLDNWNQNCRSILDFLSNEANVNEKYIKTVIEKLKTSDIDENSQTAALAWCLHGFFVPTQRIVTTDIAGKKSHKKFTIKDSQKSFLIMGNSVKELDEYCSSISNEKMHPIILVIADDILSIKEIFLYFDGVKYPFESFLKAIDICFKMFYVFKLEFPLASSMFWSFIEEHFFKIENSKKGAAFPKVHILMEYLNSDNYVTQI